jgi:plasmid stabilization system protein ParE
MQVAFRPEAQAEVLEAKAWYEQQLPGLGLDFARALDAAIASAVRTPQAYPYVEAEFRRILLRRFPYSVIYRVLPAGLLVVAVFHHRRKPGAWLSRVGG